MAQKYRIYTGTTLLSDWIDCDEEQIARIQKAIIHVMKEKGTVLTTRVKVDDGFEIKIIPHDVLKKTKISILVKD